MNYYQIHKNKTPKLLIKNRRLRKMKVFTQQLDKVAKTSEKVVESLEAFNKPEYKITGTLFRFVTMRTNNTNTQ